MGVGGGNKSMFCFFKSFIPIYTHTFKKKSVLLHKASCTMFINQLFYFILFYLFIFLLFRATPEAYGGAQARGAIRAVAARPTPEP